MQRLRKFRELPWRDKLMLAEAAVLINLACLALFLLPFRWIAPWLGRRMEETARTQSAADQWTARRVRAAIRVAGGHLSWKARCLAQAIAATIMLRLRGIDGTVYMGVAKAGDRKMTAHAWLRSGNTIVTGGRGLAGQSVVATFAFPRK